MSTRRKKKKKKTQVKTSKKVTTVIEKVEELKKEEVKKVETKKEKVKPVKKTTPTKKKETNTSSAKKKTTRRRTTKKKEKEFILPKKEELFVLEGNQLKKPIKEEPKKVSRKCKVKGHLFKKKPKKVYNKLERKQLVEHDDYSELELKKYRDNPIYKWPLVFLINRFKVMIFDMVRLKKRLKYGTFRDKVLIIIMLLLILGCIAGIFFVGYIVVNAPTVSKEKLYTKSSTVLYDADGHDFARLGAQNREVVSYDEIPEVLVDAIVATEDSRFFQHNGVDLARFSKAVLGQLVGRSDAGGGSTLTMQVSKNVATSGVSSGIKGIIRKFTDIYLSVFVLEKQYTKEEILEFYVNISFLGSAYGVEQASQAYFGKSASELTLPEAAMIAGLFQAPTSYNPYNYPEKANSRKNQVLNLMYRHGYITKEECENAKNVPIKDLLVGSNNTGINEYISFIDTVVSEVEERTGNNPYTVSMNIYTTMKPDKQRVVNDIENGVSYTWKSDYAEAGIAVLSVKDGSIVAIGAGRNKTSERSYNYAKQISRHPGSTAKPVIDYGPAVEYLGWGTSQTIIDDNYTYSGGGQIKNWDNGYKGIMTIKTALASSRNIPALLTFQQTTSAQKKEFANNLGWKPEEDGNGNLLETDSIGGFNGVSPLQSAAAYATFARGGTYIEPYSFRSLEYTDTGETYTVNPTKRQVMSEDTAYIITQILHYAVTSGNVATGSVSGTELGAKTGTSTVDSAVRKSLGITGNIIGDSWENVISADYAISTWYGYDKITKEHYLSNSEGGAARKAITKLLVKGIMEPNAKFSKPDTIETATIELETDPLELASPYTPDNLKETSYFKDGTAPTTVSERFAQLNNPSNLKASSSGSTVTLSWTAAATPNAISNEWLTKYFTESKIYKNWADKYLHRRIEYNNSVFGTFGYRVYKTTSSGTTDLGFTTNTSMTVGDDAGDVTYTVKSSYSNFTSNMSKGITAKIEGHGSTGGSYTMAFNGKSCLSYSEYAAIGNDAVSSKVTVKRDGTTVNPSSEGLTVSASCYDAGGNSTSCPKSNDGGTYTIKFALQNSSRSTLASTSVKISNQC